jgi:hypothetical protein
VAAWLASPEGRRLLPDPRSHRIYMDHGTEGLDAEYRQYQEQVDEIMAAAGFQEVRAHVLIACVRGWVCACMHTCVSACASHCIWEKASGM